MKNPAGPGTRGAGTGGASGAAGGGAAAAIPIATFDPGPGAAPATGPAGAPAAGSCRSQPARSPDTGPAGGAGAVVSGPPPVGAVVSGLASDAAIPGTGSAVAGAGSPTAGAGSGAAGTAGTADLVGLPPSPKTAGAWAGGPELAHGGRAGAWFAGVGALAGACGSLTGHAGPDGRSAPSGRTCLVTLSSSPVSRLAPRVGLAAWRPTGPGLPTGPGRAAGPGPAAGAAWLARPAAGRAGACRSSWAISAGAVSAVTAGATSLATAGVNPAEPRAPAAHCGAPPRFSAGRRSGGAGAARGTRVGWPAEVA